MSAPEEFQRLRALCESASEGLWSAGSDGVEGCFFVTGPRIPPYGVQSPHGITVMDAADAILIAEARTALPAALACLTELLALAAGDPVRDGLLYKVQVRETIARHFPGEQT